MKCAICRSGNTEKGFATVVLEKEETVLVFKRVPSDICDTCGEQYISSDVNRSLLNHAREELNRNITLEMLNFVPKESAKPMR